MCCNDQRKTCLHKEKYRFYSPNAKIISANESISFLCGQDKYRNDTDTVRGPICNIRYLASIIVSLSSDHKQ